jgi:hypothetical protein
MTQPDTSGWEAVGETSNTRYFAIRDRVLAAVPLPGSNDTLATARENVAFQGSFFAKRGQRGVVVVLLDNLVGQDKDARRVYQTEIDVERILVTCLVGGTLLSRAMASFFLGLAKPRVPIKMCKNLDEALAHADGLLAATKEKP